MATFGERLKEVREENKLPQTVLAEKLGISNVTISRWESDSQMPDRKMLLRLAEFFDVDYFWLLGVEEERKCPYTDEEWAEIAEAEENEILQRMVERIKDLSPEMQRMVKMTVNNAHQIDKERGRLASQYVEEE